MAPFCLLPKHADAFLQKLKSGELTPEALMNMTSAERHATFADILGERNATPVNALFESKLLLQHQQEGIINWAQKVGGLKPEVQRDIFSRVARMDKVLEPTELTGFLSDLAQQKLGFGVTMEEAGRIADLSKAVQDAKTANDFEGYINARIAFREGVADITPKHLTGPQKAAAYVRMGALSWPTTLVKLSAVAASRMVTTPATDAVAMGLAKVFPGLSEGAPRYGTTSPTVAMKAEAAAQAAQWTDGMIDAGRMLQNKGSRLDVAFGKSEHVGHAWYEYSGSLHGALKEPIKRAEFARSLYRRTADAMARGEDTKSLPVKMRLATEAYDDATGAISMQDNVISSAWNAGLKRLEQENKKTGKTEPIGTFISTALRMDTPVMKAPTNNVIEASEWIGGLLTGGAKTAWAYAHGIEDLQPIERDVIIRQMSRGAVGAALMTLYYFKHDLIQFGGFYKGGEQRKPSDVPARAARVGDVTVPKLLLHNPLFDALQFSASMARVTEQHGNKADNGLASATGAAAFGLLDELPVIKTASDAKRIIGESGGMDFLQQQLANEAVPGVVQWVAKKADHDTKRKPTGMVEHLEANLPGLRGNVPEKKRKR